MLDWPNKDAEGILSGAENLLPVLKNDWDEWKRDESIRTVDGRRYCIKRYRPALRRLDRV